jgi:hypothetical protein
MKDYYPDRPMSDEAIRYAAGTGNWRWFGRAGLTLETIVDVAREWADAIHGVTSPWLCWCVDPDWCVEQQRQVLRFGWTPVVGHDPRVPMPPILSGAIAIDFNARLDMPTLWPHFPLEFAHLWCPRLAFWHSDLLLRPEKMRDIANRFSGLSNGWMAAVRPKIGLREWLGGRLRYWELIGCTTRRASQAAFDAGCGWWMGFPYHPSKGLHPQSRQQEPQPWQASAGISS